MSQIRTKKGRIRVTYCRARARGGDSSKYAGGKVRRRNRLLVATGREEDESGGRGEEEESGARFPKISRTIPRVLSPTGGTHKRAGARMSVTEGRKTDEREVRDVPVTVPRRSGPSVADRTADEARRVLPI